MVKRTNSDAFFWAFFAVFGLVFVVIGLIVGIAVGTGTGEIGFSIMFTSIFSGVGLIFAIIGAIPLTQIIKKNKQNKWLMANGKAIWGKVTHVEMDRRYTANGSHPYKIYAEYEDESIVSTLYKFKSDNVWMKYGEIEPGDDVRIYVHPQNMAMHFMDVDSIKPNGTRANIVDFT